MRGHELHLKIVLAVVAGAILIIVGPTAALWLKVEACIDSGGRWNEHAGVCEQARRN